jgi:hypothetical protein
MMTYSYKLATDTKAKVAIKYELQFPLFLLLNVFIGLEETLGSE